jgi:uncharacterized membrane protein YedE/YeeE
MTRSLPALGVALISGVIFGIGLAVSRMIDPRKILNFLDVASIPSGGWDPSLAFVMGGGLLVAAVGLRLDRFLAMPEPLAAPTFVRQDRFRIDRPLVAGAAIFGVGWGLSGFCPGPAFADLGLVPGSVAVFVVALLLGSWAAGQMLERSEARDASPASFTAPAE